MSHKAHAELVLLFGTHGSSICMDRCPSAARPTRTVGSIVPGFLQLLGGLTGGYRGLLGSIGGGGLRLRVGTRGSGARACCLVFHIW